MSLMIKVTISKTQNLHMFTKLGDLSFVEKYALNPLIHLNLYLDLFLLISMVKCQPLCLNILKTMRGGNHAKNVLSFMKGTYVLKIVTNKFS